MKEIFSRVQERIRNLIAFESDAPLLEKLDSNKINLGSSEEEVARDVKNRILFLFEVAPSVNYQSIVTKFDSKDSSQFEMPRMESILDDN